MKRKSKMLRGILASTLALSLLMTGCSNSESGQSDDTPSVSSSASSSSAGQTPPTVSSTNSGEDTKTYGAAVTVGDIKSAYGASESDSLMPLYNVAPDETFEFRFKSNWLEEDTSVDPVDLVSVHTDPSCSEESKLYTSNLFDENDPFLLKVAPIGGVLTTDSEEYGAIEKDKEVWGNASMYYLAVWYDTEADGFVKLDSPVIIPFTVKHELKAPTIKGVVSADGRFKLTWEPVEGATAYNVYTYGATEINSTGIVNDPVAGADKAYDVNGECHLIKDKQTTETEFDNFAGKDHGLAIYEHNELDEDDTDYILGQNYCVNGAYFITAVFGEEESGLSNMVTTDELILPFRPVDEDDLMFGRFDTEADLPQTISVLNIDGSATERNVSYKFHWGKTLEGDDYPRFRYSVEGTAITGEVSMDPTKADYSGMSEGDSPRGFVDSSSNTSAKAEPDNQTEFNPDSDVPTIIDDEETESDDKTLYEQQLENTENHIENGNNASVEGTDYAVFAESPEEEWLARNLIAGNTEISLEAFPEIQQYDTLMDVFQKVYYQNPYVLGVTRYKYDYANLELEVEYCYDKDEIAQKQAEIKASSEDIISDAITSDMSDEEKCRALYDYLNDNTAYDEAAVEAAEQSGFTKNESWKDFEDAFNAYGIIVKKTGVCQSYALSYKLLCDMCGVENKVITGNMDGSLPHAWSSVKLDGEWYQTDCTNNETNCGVPYFLYEAGADVIGLTGYTEDDLYELDSIVGEFAVSDSDREYYEINGLCVSDADEFKSVLGSCLDNGSDSVIAVRFIGSEPDQSGIIAAIKEVYNMKGMEDKLNELGFGYTNSFIILVPGSAE